MTYMSDRRCAYRVLVGRPERNRPLGRARHGWEDNITMDLQEVGWEGMDRWRELVKAVMDPRSP
jgi:hypothetical protein